MALVPTSDQPLVVVGAGPIGLAAAAHAVERGLPTVVLEAGDGPGAAVADWGHVRLFSPWRELVDPSAARLSSDDEGVPDSLRLRLYRTDPETGGQQEPIEEVLIDVDDEFIGTVVEAFGERRPSLSPDGRWLAYQSDETRRQPEIVVRPFPNVEEGRWQISSEGGEGPLWSRDGAELFYRAENKLMVTRVETGGTFDYTTPDTLFDLSSYEFPGSNRNYDISPEGERFLFLKTAGNENASDSRPSFVVTLNWFEELRERVPIP